MLTLLRTLALLLATASAAIQSAPMVVYDNTSSDTLNSVFYSAGPYAQIGDRVQMQSASRVASVQTQFFSLGVDATFDASLQFYSVSGAIYTPIGAAVQRSGIAIGADQVHNVDFDIAGGVDLPADLVLMLSIANVSSGGDIALNFFDPPTVGQSSNEFFLTDDGTGLAEASTFADIDNLYLRIVTVNAVPEPGTAWLVLAPLAALVRRRCLMA